MKFLVFDSSAIISLATNDLLWTLKHLKEFFKGDFYIPKAVRAELVDTPYHSHKFKLESIMISRLIEENILNTHEELEVDSLLQSINHMFSAKGEAIKIVSRGEVEALALSVKMDALAYVVDERTMRLVIENPEKLRRLLESKLHTKINVNEMIVKNLKNYTQNVKVVRSSELMMIAIEKGILNGLIDKKFTKKEVIDGLLWGLRLRGCAISTEEIEDLKKLV